MKIEIELAKTLISHESELIGKIGLAAFPAEEEFAMIIGSKEFCRYKNYKDTIAQVRKDDAYNNRVTFAYDGNHKFNLLDIIEIKDSSNKSYNGFYEIVDKTEDTISIIKNNIGDSQCTIIDRKMKKYTMVYAWLICYYSTFTIQELKKNEVLIMNEKFGDGDIKSYQQSQIKILRDDYLRNVNILVGRLGIRDK